MQTRMKIIVAVLVVASLGVAMPGLADAQGYSTPRPGGRTGTWEFSLPIIYTDSARIDGQNGTSVDVSSDVGWGFGLGYNFNDNFQLNGLLSFGYRSYEATTVGTDGSTKKYNNYMDTSTLSVNGVYYFLNGNMTPFASAGVGVTYVDTNIPTGSGSTACWYDPWYGYVCSSYLPTKTENDISYNAGVGVRYDVNRQFGMQVGYYKTWIDISKTSNTPAFDSLRFDILFRM